MGVIRKAKCNSCGAEWEIFEGVGLLGEQKPAETNQADQCPECGSSDIEKDQEICGLWD